MVSYTNVDAVVANNVALQHYGQRGEGEDVVSVHFLTLCVERTCVSWSHVAQH